jgi:hypothetical protein
MRGNPTLNSLRTAEAAGYPALLIVSAVCLGLVVAPVALLGLTDAGWVLGLALLYLVIAIVVLSVAVSAALSDGDEPEPEWQGPESPTSDGRIRSDHPPSADPQLGRSARIGGLGARSQASRSLATRRRPSALPAPVAQAPPRGAARSSAPERPQRVPDVDGAAPDELALGGAEARERGAPTSLRGDAPRVDAPRDRRVMRGTPGRRSTRRN